MMHRCGQKTIPEKENKMLRAQKVNKFGFFVPVAERKPMWPEHSGRNLLGFCFVFLNQRQASNNFYLLNQLPVDSY